MREPRIGVLIVDDHEIARRGLRDMLETADDIRVVGDAESTFLVSRLIKELSPDVLLIDLKFGDDETAGWIKIREVKEVNPQIKVIAITAYPPLMIDAWKSGADQVVTKQLSRVELLDLIRTVYAHKVSRQPESLLSRSRQSQLSPREYEVLTFLDKGLSDKEISKALNIEVNTTKNHVKSILQKLNVPNRRKASIKAREQGILK